MDRTKGRFSFAIACDKIREAKETYPDTSAIYIERKANGQVIIETLSDEIPGIIGVDPEELGSKNARWEAASKYQNAMNIYLPLQAAWTDNFIDELAAVPNGRYDDDADALAQLVIKELGARKADALIRALEKELIDAGIDITPQLDKDGKPLDPFEAVYGVN